MTLFVRARRGMLMALALFSLGAFAAGARSVREQTEASMVVTGDLVVATDGHVQGYALDHARDLPAVVTDLIAKNIARWRFEPVLRDGAAVVARARMSLRIVAKPARPGRYALRLQGAHFGDAADGGIKRLHVVVPEYPHQALDARVSGTVFVALKIGVTGVVEDAAAEQVNLGVVAKERDMKRWRHVLAESALRAARQWTFSPAAATRGGLAESRYVMVPVAFNLKYEHPDAPARSTYGYGHWKLYIPGPREPLPWWDAHKMLSGSVDALPDSGVFPIPSNLQLTTSLGGA